MRNVDGKNAQENFNWQHIIVLAVRSSLSLSLCFALAPWHFDLFATVAERYNRFCRCFWHSHCCSRYWLQKSQAIMNLCVHEILVISINACLLLCMCMKLKSFNVVKKQKANIWIPLTIRPCAVIHRFARRPYNLIRLVGEFRYWRLVVGTNWSFMFGPGIFVMFQFYIGCQAFARSNRSMCECVLIYSIVVQTARGHLHTLCMKLIRSYFENSFGVCVCILSFCQVHLFALLSICSTSQEFTVLNG